MPKAAVYEYDGPVFWKHDIGFTRQILAMEPKTEPLGVQKPSDLQLRVRIAPPDTGHHPTPCNRVHYINHLRERPVYVEPSYQSIQATYAASRSTLVRLVAASTIMGCIARAIA